MIRCSATGRRRITSGGEQPLEQGGRCDEGRTNPFSEGGAARAAGARADVERGRDGRIVQRGAGARTSRPRSAPGGRRRGCSRQIGRASYRERVCQYVKIPVVAGS